MKLQQGFYLLFATSSLASPLSIFRPVCSLSTFSATRAAQVKAAFKSSGIIPDSVANINPTTELQVKYGNFPENLGNNFTVPQTLQEPMISFEPELGYDPTTTKYTYIQIDLDAPGPSLPILRHFLHHIIYDLQPSCVAAQTPVTQARYMPLTPLSVASHRYVSLLYRQPPNYVPPPLNLIEDVVRAPFNITEYVRRGGLVLIGGNFMREGLGTTVCAVVPGCTSSGIGYGGPKDGTALPTNLLSKILNGVPIKD